MKKLIASVLLAISLSANAETWAPLVESLQGDKLIVDYESVVLTEYFKDTRTKSWYMQANMYLVESNTSIVAKIDAKECVTKDSGTIVLSHDGTTYSKFWNSRGNKMYDAQGAFLCLVTKRLLQRQEKQVEKIAI